MKPIYLDYNATTPIDPAVADAMIPYLREHFGNPSSAHAYGTVAKAAVESARRQVAALIGARPEEVIFTSGGSESNNMVIQGVAHAARARGRHLISSAIEHPAILEPLAALEREGFRVTLLPVDERGFVDPRELERAIDADTVLVTIMHANNEVGTIQPIAELSAIAHAHGVAMHTDAAQSVGKIPVRVDELGVDFLTIAAHKLYAPKGVGALYVRSGRDLPRFVHGASHEMGRRAGTENVLEIVGFGRAAELASERLAATGQPLRALRDRLLDHLTGALGDLRVNGDLERSLPNTLSVCFRGVDASTLLAEIGDEVAASAGAACHAEGVDLSTVLQAMAVPVEEAMGTVRFSVGRSTTPDEVDRAAAIVSEAVKRLAPGPEHAVNVMAAPAADVKLTRYTHGMGCACKLRPQELEQVLAKLPKPTDPAVLVGVGTSDDAAVYQLTDDLALVQTVDFFTPIADDPYDFGAISAANSLSDVYAMGAQARFALSIVGFPSRRLPLDVLSRILEGATDTAREAGIDIIGGHSVEDTEPKFGLAVTGVVHPDRIVTNAGLRVGDVLVLTKPIGTGILATAAKRGLGAPHHIANAIATMRSLNRHASEAMVEVGVNACTDVTGFGLLGHLLEMARGSGVTVTLDAAVVPILDGARDLAAADVVPGGTIDNLAFASCATHFEPHLSRVEQLLLADAQSSGGLLIAVPEARLDALIAALASRDVATRAVIGRVADSGEPRVLVR
ncbi:MAG: selenide, water dikinase SelD [Planctomycetes bacterium]|nr:selenide, water dikinase SelD [Planctomycetota bacterium]